MAYIGLRELCEPAKIYLIISLVILVVMIYQTQNTATSFCWGGNQCNIDNLTLVIIVKLVYILFWTWILNILCKMTGTPIVSWILVAVPIALFLLFVFAIQSA
jgi:hypothetical protein